jgi:hypothetical protein
MMKSALVPLILGVSLAASAAPRNTPPVLLGQQDLIQGLGEEFPAARDLSRSENFHVYRFLKDGIAYVQINRLDGTVLTAVALAGQASFFLPVGELPASQVVVSTGARNSATPAAGACPCSAQVVYDGPEGTIIVVYGSNGQVIQVVVFPRTLPR